jgi:hypothetical protein
MYASKNSKARKAIYKLVKSWKMSYFYMNISSGNNQVYYIFNMSFYPTNLKVDDGVLINMYLIYSISDNSIL